MKIRRLGDVALVIAGQSPPGDTYNVSGVGLPFFQGKADFGTSHPVPRVWCSRPERIAEPGDILVSVRAPVGPSNIADVRSCIGRGLAAVRAGHDVDAGYLALLIRANEKKLASQGQGSTFAAITRRDIEGMTVPVPSLADQRHIAAMVAGQLAASEVARTAAAAGRSTAVSLRAAAYRSLLAGSEFDSWPSATVASLLASPLRTGVSGAPSTTSVIRGLSLAAVRRGRLDLAQSRPVAVDPFTNRTIREGRFYVVRGNGRLDLVGRAGLAPRSDASIVFPDLLIEMHMDPTKVHPEYLQLIWDGREVRSDIESRARTASGIHKINLGNLAQVVVPLPPMETQRRIASELRARLDAIDTAVAATDEELEAIEALPAALLRRAFDHLAA